MKLRTLGLLAAAVAGLAFGSAAKASGVLWIATSNVVDGVKSAADGGAGDDLPLVDGTIQWQTSIGSWNVVVSTGVTKNTAGSANAPTEQLTVTAVSTSATPGSLFLLLADNGFGPYNDGIVSNLSITNTVGSSSTGAKVIGNSSNAAISLLAGGGTVNGGTTVTSIGPFALGATTQNGSVASLAPLYALGTLITITPTSGSNFVLGANAGFAPVPVPAAAWMGLSTLTGIGGLGMIRRRARRA